MGDAEVRHLCDLGATKVWGYVGYIRVIPMISRGHRGATQGLPRGYLGATQGQPRGYLGLPGGYLRAT